MINQYFTLPPERFSNHLRPPQRHQRPDKQVAIWKMICHRLQTFHTFIGLFDNFCEENWIQVDEIHPRSYQKATLHFQKSHLFRKHRERPDANLRQPPQQASKELPKNAQPLSHHRQRHDRPPAYHPPLQEVDRSDLKLCKDVRCNQWWWDSLPKTNSSSLKIGGWKTICLLGNPICSGAEISFREGNPVTSSCTKIIVNHGFATCGLGKDSAILSILWNQNMRVWKHSVLVNLPGVYPCRTIRVQQDFRTCDPFRVASSIHIDITSILRSFQIFQMRLQATTPWQKKTVQENFQAGHSSDSSPPLLEKKTKTPI